MAAPTTGSYNTIKVVARFRPQNKIELESGGQPIVAFETEDTCNLNSKEAAGAFTFDRVFDMNCRQSDVFNFSIRSTVDDILNGYNGTVFAYGQTGAGKSYTMMGSDIDDDDTKGIIPRIVEQIFASILQSPSNIEYTVRVSYMEIYMERIRDLLAPQNDNLPVHEEKSRGVYVKGLLEVYVSSVMEVYEVMRRGGQARAVAATNMNQESSRSHSIFVLTVTQKNVETGSAKSGQLFLVDLAGSEKVGKTGASGQTLEEAKKINKSLSALGMVINALTDGKSTHIPYRDSKLTRILQESLGGNSRTTLIINCSPSSYNDAETLSTLRFGVRAKAIKNKAKVNAELSPAELKALLKKAQSQVTTYQEYASLVESELQLWRSGEAVPRDRWTSPVGADAPKSDLKPSPSALARVQDTSRASSPSKLDSKIERAGTPSIVLEKDERDEFLKRENELQDQLAEKESALSAAEKALREAKEELASIKSNELRSMKENEQMTSEVNELRMTIEKVSFEAKEAQITMDSLKEANSELTTELDEVKHSLLEAKYHANEANTTGENKDRKKAERMAKMMAGFDLGEDVFSENERKIRDIVDKVTSLYEVSASGEAVAPDDLQQLKSKILETQGNLRQTELALHEQEEASDRAAKRRQELETKLTNVEKEYEQLLESKLDASDISEIKARLKEAHASKQEMENESLEDAKRELTRKLEENQRLKATIEDLDRRIKLGGLPPAGANGSVKTVHQQIAEFDAMKKSLMRDLQNRCERVVELEISLDETREQYNNVLRSSNNKAQQKKMAFLERNLEQLTLVQRQLVEQNSTLKKEVAIAERKLIARNERIQSLEVLLQDSQEKLTAANHRFEAQLAAVKERVEAAKLANQRGMNNTASSYQAPSSPFSFVTAGSRIAKPLRGGGGSGEPAPSNPVLSGVQAQDQQSSPSTQNKRSSWFFNSR